MDSTVIAHALGLPFEAPPVQAIVKALGLTKAPRAKKDDPDDYLEAKPQGIQLMFVDDDYLKRAHVARYGNAPMIFVSATLYSGRQSDDPSYARYPGPLPENTTFDDAVDQLESKLGPPTQVYEDEGVVFTRSWKRNSYTVVFSYNSAGTLECVHLNWDAYMSRLLED